MLMAVVWFQLVVRLLGEFTYDFQLAIYVKGILKNIHSTRGDHKTKLILFLGIITMKIIIFFFLAFLLSFFSLLLTTFQSLFSFFLSFFLH